MGVAVRLNAGRRPRLTLPRFFVALVGAIALLSALLLTLAVRTASRAIVATGDTARAARASVVAGAVETDLGVAARAVEDFERAIAAGVVAPHERASVDRYLTTELIALRSLTELTLTVATLTGYDDDGEARLASGRGDRWQVSVFRNVNGDLSRRLVTAGDPGVPDPTAHDTFRASANRESRGQALWSDLAFSQLDAARPQAQRRKTMTVQKAIFAGAQFIGVLRAGIVSDALDRVGVASRAAPDDPHVVFICDSAGRLITRLGPGDDYVLVDQDGHPDPDGDLRVRPRAPVPALDAALALARDGASGGQRLVVGGVPYLLTLAPLAEGRAQDWQVGILVPESRYVGGLRTARNVLLALLALVVAATVTVGLLGARTLGRGVRALARSTEAMRQFQFAPAIRGSRAMPNSPFAEIRDALDSVERAKTALRAMVKYVPIDLVRRLYDSGKDPVLGAELTPVSIMFSDIADFTTHAEAMAPADLAQALGRYLQAATQAVESTGGTVDKFIGDALMVLWNVPEALPNHPAAACRAALACAAATEALGQSPGWRAAGLPSWRTRFGIHTDQVLVGNFGAPDRLNYTAMGDGVNLASRLEGLNKVYGTTILVSEAVRETVRGAPSGAEGDAEAKGEEFVFRRIDRVAVKGKTKGVAIYELVGLATTAAIESRREAIATYERALDELTARRFDEAARLFRSLGEDPAATVMLERCRLWSTRPPPSEWNGTWTAMAK